MRRLRLLGEPLLFDAAAHPVRPWRPHVALLARLALEPEHALSRGVLAATIWPDAAERTARASLRQVLFHLRRDVGAVVRSCGETLQLDRECVEVDAVAFDHLLDAGRPAEALSLYGGEFLAGFYLPASRGFEEWAASERSRLARRAAKACAELETIATDAGRSAEAIRWSERWLELEPYSEVAAARLLALRAQTGDAGGAIAFYDAFTARLENELSVAPGTELTALAERIRGAGALPHTPERLIAREVGRAEAALVGREEELARLLDRWAAAAAGKAQLALLTGEPGIGKSRLAREVTSRIGRCGATTLQGRAYEIERGVPYAALADVLRAALDAPGLAGVDAASLGELSRIVPEIATRFRNGVAPPASDMETGRVRLLEAVRAVVENLAYEQPVLLLLDDLPWADEASLTTLHHLWRRLRDSPVLLLGTARSADLSVNPALQRMLSAASRDAPAQVETIKLGPLRIDQIARFAAEAGLVQGSDAAGAKALATVLERESGGNPLFLVEAVRARAEGTGSAASREGVRLAVVELTADLTPPARTLLQAAAVLGRHFPLPLVAAVAGLEHPAAVAALDELSAKRLLQRVEYEYDFVHDLVRESVYAALGLERRRMLHRAACERLSPRPEEEVGLERASALAMHAMQGGLAAAATRWLLQAAHSAQAVFAGAEAERFLAQAVEFASTREERRVVWERIGDLRRARSRFSTAVLAYHDAIGQSEPHSAARLGLRIKLLDASLRAGVLRFPDAADALTALVADAEVGGSEFLRDTHRAAADAYRRSGDLTSGEEHALRAVDAARQAGDARALVGALLLRAQIGTLHRSLEDALPLIDEAVRLAGDHGLTRELCDALTERATELCRQGRWTEAVVDWRRALLEGETAGAIGAVTVANLNLSDVLLRRGDWEEASAHLDAASGLADQFDFSHVRADVQVNRALLAWHRGDRSATGRAARRALELARSLGTAAAANVASALLALVQLESGNVAGARQTLGSLPDRAASHHPTWGDDHEFVIVARVRTLASQGDRDAANRLLAMALREEREPYATAVFLLERARLMAPEDRGRAEELIREARLILTKLGAKPLLATAERMLRP